MSKNTSLLVAAGIAVAAVVLGSTAQAAPVQPRSPICLRVPDGNPGDTAVINITNTDVTARGYGALRSSTAPLVPTRPTANQFSSVNFAPGPANPNLAFVTIGPTGFICYDSDGGTTNVILDLAATIPATNINNIEPTRLLDTRPAASSDLADAEAITRRFINAINAGDLQEAGKVITLQAFQSDNFDILLLNTPHRFEECFFVGQIINCNFTPSQLNFSVGFNESGSLINVVNFASNDGL